MNVIERNDNLDNIQSGQYDFPYHYIPDARMFPNFSKNWSFSASYISAINIFSEWFSKISKSKDHKHMDFGCGDGGFINAITSFDQCRNVQFYGIDYDENAVRWADQFSRGSSEFSVGDIANLPTDEYDSGSLVEVYEHIPPAECHAFLSTIAATLKEGASMFVTVPSIEKPIIAKHYRHFDFEILKQEFSVFFDIELIFGFEKKSLLTNFIRRFTSNRWWYFESIITNKIILSKCQQTHDIIDGCGRVGMVVKKKT